MATEPIPPTKREQEAIQATVRCQVMHRYFNEYARGMWDEAERANKATWSPYCDVVCEEVQAVMAEADRRRLQYEAILADTEDDPDERARQIHEAFAHLPKLRLVILLPPRHSKSTLLSRLFPTWRWLHRPQEQILTLTAADTLIRRDGLAIRDVIKSDAYMEMQARLVFAGDLPDGNPKGSAKNPVPRGSAFVLRPDQFAAEKFENTSGGGRAGHVLGAGYTGVNADVILIDDPHDIDDAFGGSPASQLRLMEEIRATYKDKVQDRLNNAIYGVVILIMQRVHPRDLADYMIEQGAKVVCLPSEYQPEHPLRYRPGMGYVKHGKDWRTLPGELLDPVRHHAGILAEKKAESIRGYEAKHMLRPTVAEGVRYKRDWFKKRYGAATSWLEEAHALAARLGEVAISVDAAEKTGARNDFTSMQVWGRQGSKRVLLDRRYGKWAYPKMREVFDELCKEWPEAAMKLIEDKSAGTALADACEDDGVAGIIRINPQGDKESRSAYAEAAYEAGNVWLPNAPWLEEYVENMVGFGAGALHDDDPDCTSQVMKRWATAARPWITREQRAVLAPAEQPPGLLISDAVRWDRRSPEKTYYLGIVPGWHDACAAIVDARGNLASLVEAAGVEGFVSALVLESEYWTRIGGGRYAEIPGQPVAETVRALTQQRVRMSGLAGKLVGQKNAGWRGTKPEVAQLWGEFLACLGEHRAVVNDARTLAQLETVVEEDGVPRMASGGPLGGRVLALLLALSAMRAAPREESGLPLPGRLQIAPTQPADLWSVGRR